MNTDYDAAHIIRSCARKKGYPTEEIAAKAAASIRAFSPGAEVRTYGCRHCGLYHVGGTPRVTSTEEIVLSRRRTPVYRRGRRMDDSSYRKESRRRVRSDSDDDALD